MVLRIGHRGACGYAPENTLPSFQKALDLGVDMIELDVHMCKSGEVVVLHDSKIDRTMSGKGKVSSYTLSELREFTIDDNLLIPTLDDVIDLVGNKAQLNIELKGKKTAKPVAQILQQYPSNRFLVSSFDYNKLKVIREELPRFRTGYIHRFTRFRTPNFAKLKGVYSVHPDLNVDFIYMSEAHSHGMHVYAWTVNKESDISRLVNLGVDGIISDFPDKIPR